MSSEAQLAAAVNIHQTESKIKLEETDTINKTMINQIGTKTGIKFADAIAKLQVTSEKK